MSTVLTNGIIIPDNGSRNWGGDLANNWNILDVHVGYMTDVKNRVTTLENSVTTLENSVAENTANIQINASNISALQTSKQDTIEDLETIRAGATAGATAVQPSALNNYVDLTSEQTISSLKVFSDGANFSYTRYMIQPGYDLTEAYSKTIDSNFSIVTANATTFARFDFAMDHFCAFRGDDANGVNLGTSTNKWKTLNGLNPGALSLPNVDEKVDVTSQVVNNNSVFQYTNNLYDGWLVVTAFADNVAISNQGFECRSVKSIDDAVTTNIALRLNETAYIRFANFTKFAYVNLFKSVGNV